jgi:hypothetical protein
VPSETPDAGLLGEAKRLDAAAIEAGEESTNGRDLRGRAAALRVQALGERIYPVLVCGSCFQLTGWLDAEQRCDSCLRRAQLQAAYSDAHGGWVRVGDERVGESPPKPAGGSLRGRLAWVRHPREARERATADAWLAHVRPDETGPIEPEDGYELEVARRDELAAADGSGMILRFHTVTCRFAAGSWNELETTRIARRDLLVPPELPASLPVEQIVEAWGDYRSAVDAVNRAAWSKQSAQREAQRQAQAAHADAVREQRGTVELLEES